MIDYGPPSAVVGSTPVYSCPACGAAIIEPAAHHNRDLHSHWHVIGRHVAVGPEDVLVLAIPGGTDIALVSMLSDYLAQAIGDRFMIVQADGVQLARVPRP